MKAAIMVPGADGGRWDVRDVQRPIVTAVANAKRPMGTMLRVTVSCRRLKSLIPVLSPRPVGRSRSWPTSPHGDGSAFGGSAMATPKWLSSAGARLPASPGAQIPGHQLVVPRQRASRDNRARTVERR